MPLIHLDMIWHKPDKTHISREEFDNFLESKFKEEKWIMDGDYSRTLEVRMKNADTIFFLDYSVETCLDGIRERIGKKREDMPWVADCVDPELKRSVEEYPNKQTPIIYELIEKYRDKNIIVFKSREEAERYV